MKKPPVILILLAIIVLVSCSKQEVKQTDVLTGNWRYIKSNFTTTNSHILTFLPFTDKNKTKFELDNRNTSEYQLTGNILNLYSYNQEVSPFNQCFITFKGDTLICELGTSKTNKLYYYLKQ